MRGVVADAPVGASNAEPQPFMGPVVSAAVAARLVQAQADMVAKGGKVLLQMGAWASNFILGMIGLYFMKISLNDSRLFESDFYRVVWQKFRLQFSKLFGTFAN